MQRQVLWFKRHRERQMSHSVCTVTRPSMSQLRSNAKRHHRNSTRTAWRSTTKSRWTRRYVQHSSGPRTRSRMSSTVKVGATWVSPCRKSPMWFTQKSKEERRSIVIWRTTSPNSGKHVDWRIWRRNVGEPRNALCNIDYTIGHGCPQTKLTPEWIDEQVVDVRVPMSILEETAAVMNLAPHAQALTGPECVTTQSQIPQSKWRWDEAGKNSQIRFRDKVVGSSCPTENRQQRIDAADAVPKSSEEKERDSLNQAARAWNTECLSGTRFERSSLPPRSSSNGDAGGSRAHQTCGDLAEWKRPAERNQFGLARGRQPDCDMVQQHSSVQDPGAQAQSKQKRIWDQQACLGRCQSWEQAEDRENRRSERLQQIRCWVGRCHGHIPARDFNHREIDGQEPYILAKWNRKTEHELRDGSSHHDEDLNVNSRQQKVSMMMKRTTEQITDGSWGNSRLRWDRPVLLKFGTLTTVENTHNTADTKYSVYHVEKIIVKSKDRRDSIRNGSTFREWNRFAFTWTRWIATLPTTNKKSPTRSRTRWWVGESTHNPQEFWWKGYEWLGILTTESLARASSRTGCKCLQLHMSVMYNHEHERKAHTTSRLQQHTTGSSILAHDFWPFVFWWTYRNIWALWLWNFQ